MQLIRKQASCHYVCERTFYPAVCDPFHIHPPLHKKAARIFISGPPVSLIYDLASQITLTSVRRKGKEKIK